MWDGYGDTLQSSQDWTNWVILVLCREGFKKTLYLLNYNCAWWRIWSRLDPGSWFEQFQDTFLLQTLLLYPTTTHKESLGTREYHHYPATKHTNIRPLNIQTYKYQAIKHTNIRQLNIQTYKYQATKHTNICQLNIQTYKYQATKHKNIQILGHKTYNHINIRPLNIQTNKYQGTKNTNIQISSH